MDLSTIQNIISEVLSCDPQTVTPEKNFETDLGADSLDRIEIIMRLEDALNIAIPDQEAESILTVGDAIEKINKLIG